MRQLLGYVGTYRKYFNQQVHLKSHKRRNRSSKHQNVFWRTQTVPIQELSIDLQNDVMELQAAQEGMVSIHQYYTVRYH